MKSSPSFTHLSNQDLLAEVTRLAACERQATAALIACLIEVDTRRLYLGEGCSSLFTYCTQVLYLSEHAAYGRIEAARAARRFPRILELLANGDLSLTAIAVLAPHHAGQPRRGAERGPAQEQARGRAARRRDPPSAGRTVVGSEAARAEAGRAAGVD